LLNSIIRSPNGLDILTQGALIAFVDPVGG
jgi:hypothetical protein